MPARVFRLGLLATLALGVSSAFGVQPNSTELSRAELKFHQANVVQRFSQSHHSPADRTAIFVLNLTARSFAGTLTRFGRQQIVTYAKEALQAGCDDPMVAYGYAVALDEPGKRAAAEPSLRRAVAGLEHSDYPIVYLANAQSRLAGVLESMEHPDARELYGAAVRSYVETVRRGVYGPKEQRLLVDILGVRVSRLVPSDLAGSLCEQLAAQPGADQWTVDTLRGIYEIRRAWEARGTGYAHTVSDDGWNGFETHLRQAYVHLSAAYAAIPARPEPAAYLVQVAMGGGTPPEEDIELWFERAVKAEFDYMPAYNKLGWALRPRWGGSVDEMREFGTRCAETKRYDTQVPLVFIQTLIDVADETGDPDGVLAQAGAYARAKSILDEYIKQAEPPDDANRYRSELIGMAWRSGHFQDASPHLSKIGRVDQSITNHWNGFPSEIYTDIAAYTSSVAETAMQAREAAQMGEHARARDLYERAIGMLGPKEGSAKVGLVDRLELERVAAGLSSAEPVPLLFRMEVQEYMAGWRIIWGRWNVVDERTVSGGYSSRGTRLISMAKLGRRFELNGHIDLSKMKSGADVSAGILYGLSFDADGPRWRSVLLLPGRRAATIQDGKKPARLLPGPVGEQCDLTLKVWDDELVLVVNGQELFAGTGPESENAEPGELIGIAAPTIAEGDVVTFSGLTLRRLTTRPSELRPNR